jgi:hypothetical protein
MSAQPGIVSSKMGMPAMIERAGKPDPRPLHRILYDPHFEFQYPAGICTCGEELSRLGEQHGIREIAAIQPLQVARYREVLRKDGRLE